MDSTVKSRPNHYEVLGLSPSASSEQIKAAFAGKMSMFGVHPLAAGTQICAAYETLRDPAKRRAYDRSIGLLPEPQPRTWSIAAPQWSGKPLFGLDPAFRTRPPTLGSLPLAPRSPAAEPHPEPRTAPFIAAALRDLAAPGMYEPPSPTAQPEPVRPPEAEAEPAPQPQRREERASPPMEAGLPHDLEAEDGAIDWRRPALAAGGLVLAVVVFGAWAGWESGNDVAAAQPEEAVTLAVPPPKETDAAPAALAAPAAPAPIEAQARRQPAPQAAIANEPAERRPMPEELTLSEERALAGQAEALESEQGQPAQAAAPPAPAEAPPAAVAAAKLPLPNSVVARTIHRIGYSCGEVASTAAMEGGAPGVFKVTCTSGHSYRAQPVRGRYHFRRLAGQ